MVVLQQILLFFQYKLPPVPVKWVGGLIGPMELFQVRGDLLRLSYLREIGIMQHLLEVAPICIFI